MNVYLDHNPYTIERVTKHGHRFYTKDGKDPLPSVTSLLSTPEKEISLAKWRKNTPDWRWINKAALERGTAVHEAIEHYLLTKQINIKPKYAKLMPPLIQKMEEFIAEIHGIEFMLHNKEIGAAGTADLVCTLKNGSAAIGDYKTSETRKDTKWMKDYFTQILTYAKMYEKEIGRNIGSVMILNVYEKPKPGCNVIIAKITDKAQRKVLDFIKEQSDNLLA